MESFASFNQLIRQDPLFWCAALSGSLLFVLQLCLNFLGGGDHDATADSGSDADAGNVKWLSKQALTGFLMMFGWVGLTCRKEFELPLLATAFIALAGGAMALFLTAWLFRSARKLQSPGTVFRLEDAIGKAGIVYQRIPPGGVGKISLSLYNLTYEIDAVSHSDAELASFSPVQVVKKMDATTVVVVPIK